MRTIPKYYTNDIILAPAPNEHTPQPPPSARDLLAYQRHVLEFASTRQTADELKFSQTCVRQIVRRVADWLAETRPEPDEARGWVAGSRE